jgi:CBS domain-containing protein
MNPDLALPTFRLDHSVSIVQASPWHRAPVTVDSPAIEVMTDLTKVKAATVAPDQTLRQAEQAMVHLGVRMLFVVTHMPQIEGLITSTDLRGQRQMQLVHERNLRFDEMRVADVMTPLDSLDAIAFERLKSSTVAHVIATLQQVGRNHLLVVATDAVGSRQVRGVISRTQIERQLGATIAISDIANSFSEIERALS